jgi:hypothetical protein
LVHVPFRPLRSLEDVILETALPQFSYGAMKIVSESKSKTTGKRGKLVFISSQGEWTVRTVCRAEECVTKQ